MVLYGVKGKVGTPGKTVDRDGCFRWAEVCVCVIVDGLQFESVYVYPGLNSLEGCSKGSPHVSLSSWLLFCYYKFWCLIC